MHDVEQRKARGVEEVAHDEGGGLGRSSAVGPKVEDQRIGPAQQSHGSRDRLSRFLEPPERRQIQIADVAGEYFDPPNSRVRPPDAVGSRRFGPRRSGTGRRVRDDVHSEVLVLRFCKEIRRQRLRERFSGRDVCVHSVRDAPAQEHLDAHRNIRIHVFATNDRRHGIDCGPNELRVKVTLRVVEPRRQPGHSQDDERSAEDRSGHHSLKDHTLIKGTGPRTRRPRESEAIVDRCG